jgi:hypothetical protein
MSTRVQLSNVTSASYGTKEAICTHQEGGKCNKAHQLSKNVCNKKQAAMYSTVILNVS